MNKEKISINHKDLLSVKFWDLQLSISEYSFANLYLFRNRHQPELIRDYDLFVKGKTYDGSPFLMPTSLHVFSDLLRLQQLLKEVLFLYPIPEEWQDKFDPSVFQLSYNPSESDYLYKQKKIASYPGRKLDAKRNLMKQLLAEHSVDSVPLSSQNVEDAVRILETWKQAKMNGEGDYSECLEGLGKMQELDLYGKIFYADGTPAGFLLAEELNKKMVVIHFAKANIAFKGIYPYMFNDFAQSLEDRFLCINMEQDLGLPGLHKAKLSYQPDKILKKWRMSLV